MRRMRRNNLPTINMENCRVSRTMVEQYTLRFNSNYAVFTIDEKIGLLNCSSSYGDYSHMWGNNHGRESFKHFLIEIGLKDPNYFLGKVSSLTHFDADATERFLKQNILNARKWNDCTKEDARRAWEEVESTVDSFRHDAHGFMDELLQYKTLVEVVGFETAIDCLHYDFPVQAQIFAYDIFRKFAEILKEELEAQDEQERNS